VHEQIGPIPVDDGIGKEITTQIRTAMKTNKTFYTDSNGRDFIKRVCQYLIPVVSMICSKLFFFFFFGGGGGGGGGG
jgi:hypothetical protein